jgi:hypothetical protein
MPYACSNGPGQRKRPHRHRMRQRAVWATAACLPGERGTIAGMREAPKRIRRRVVMPFEIVSRILVVGQSNRPADPVGSEHAMRQLAGRRTTQSHRGCPQRLAGQPRPQLRWPQCPGSRRLPAHCPAIAGSASSNTADIGGLAQSRIQGRPKALQYPLRFSDRPVGVSVVRSCPHDTRPEGRAAQANSDRPPVSHRTTKGSRRLSPHSNGCLSEPLSLHRGWPNR